MKHVLVAEDDAPTRTLLVAALSDEGYLVSAAADGQAALERCAELKPDLVVLDLAMPLVDGLEFLRRRGSDCDAPVIAMSAVFRRHELGGLSVAAFVAKPFDLQVLIKAIAQSIGGEVRELPASRTLN